MGTKFLDAIVVCIAHIDVSFRAESEATWAVKGAETTAEAAPTRHEFAVGAEHVDHIGPRVQNEDLTSTTIHGNRSRPQQLTRREAKGANLSHVRPAGRKFGHAVVPQIRDVDSALTVECYVGWGR